MDFKLTILLVAFLAVACSSGQDVANQNKKADIHYSYGTQELLNKNYTQAITQLLLAAKYDPKNPEIQNNLGMAYYFKGEKEMALTHIRQALVLNPANTDATVNLASLLFEQGDLAGAEKYYLKALKDHTFEKHARTYYNLALIELRRKNTARAQGHLESAVRAEESYCPAWFQKGMLDFQMRRFKDAQKNFLKAQQGLCTNDPGAIYWQAAAEIELGNYLNARMKLDDVQTRFGNTAFGPMAQQKLSELNIIENNPRSSAGQSLITPSITPSF